MEVGNASWFSDIASISSSSPHTANNMEAVSLIALFKVVSRSIASRSKLRELRDSIKAGSIHVAPERAPTIAPTIEANVSVSRPDAAAAAIATMWIILVDK